MTSLLTFSGSSLFRFPIRTFPAVEKISFEQTLVTGIEKYFLTSFTMKGGGPSKGKKNFPVFMSGDYEFLCKMYGLSGAGTFCYIYNILAILTIKSNHLQDDNVAYIVLHQRTKYKKKH